jgi:hypothetical protein
MKLSPKGQIVFPSILIDAPVNQYLLHDKTSFDSTPSNHPVPSRQGVHCRKTHGDKNGEIPSISNDTNVSSYTINPPDP